MQGHRTEKEINKIIIHCSGKEYGNLIMIDKEFKEERGLLGVGYHHVITNGRKNEHSEYNAQYDGIVQDGRIHMEIGRHCKKHNHTSIGICLIGKTHFTSRQLVFSLTILLKDLMKKYNIPVNQVRCHYEFDKNTRCPNIKIEQIRYMLRRE